MVWCFLWAHPDIFTRLIDAARGRIPMTRPCGRGVRGALVLPQQRPARWTVWGRSSPSPSFGPLPRSPRRRNYAESSRLCMTALLYSLSARSC